MPRLEVCLNRNLFLNLGVPGIKIKKKIMIKTPSFTPLPINPATKPHGYHAKPRRS